MKVLLAHDDRIELYGLAHALSEQGVDVVGEAHTGEQVPALVARTRPSVLLLAYSFAASADWSLLHELTRRSASPKVFVLIPQDESSHGAAALEHGAAGCVSARIDPLDIAAVLRQAVAGNFYCAPPPDSLEASHNELTEREWSVLDALSRGLSNDAIGHELWLSSHTVKSHLHRIYMKLGVTNRTEAARYGLEHGVGKQLVSTESASL